MIRWLNCVAFETEQDFIDTAEERYGDFYFSNISIRKPSSFPAFFVLKEGYDFWWEPTTKAFMVERCENALQNFVNLVNELKTY